MGYVEHLQAMGLSSQASPMSAQIAEWWGWYVIDNNWYSYNETSPDARRTYKVDRLSLKPARRVCQEWASLLLNERTVISTEDESVNQWLESYLGAISFFASGQELVERAFALGTGAWVLRVQGIDPMAATSPGARIIVQRFDARQIVPLSYDEDTCTECAFGSEIMLMGKKFTQLQVHRLGENGTYRIETGIFNIQGQRIESPGIAAVMETGSATPLFALVKPALANTFVDYQPMGVSVFSDAIGAIKLVDVAFDNMYRDIWLGQKMLFLDERMLETDKNGKVRVPREKDQQLFRKTEVDSASGGKLIEEYNPDLRVGDNRTALDTALMLLGGRCGMGDDYFAFDGPRGMKTATEVVAEQSDLFRNVRKHENQLARSITTIITGILTLARTVRGEPIPEDYGAITVQFDDSIIEDTDAQRKRDLTDVAAGLMQPWEYREKWYGENEATARLMVEGGSPPSGA